MSEKGFRGASEVTRYAVSTVLAFGAIIMLRLLLPREMLAQHSEMVIISTYLIYWVVYVTIFGWWTVRLLSRLNPAELRAYARSERASAESKWVKGWGIKGAANLSGLGAIVAMAAAIAMSRFDVFREDWRWLTVGGIAVVWSWVFMIVTYAAEYLELDYRYRAEGEQPMFDFSYLDEEPLFGDYLNQAVMVSTMGASVPATPTNRHAWKEIRYNTLIAFTFNTMVIAMVVSVLSATLAA